MTILILFTTFLIILMSSFIVFISFLHQKRHIIYLEKISKIQADYEKNLIQAQLEIQEQTFQHISREIHDNITLSLTLSKLNLHTLDRASPEENEKKLDAAIGLISRSISELSDISKSLNADIISQQGLLKALEEEINRIRHTGLFHLVYEVSGNPVFMDSRKELIIFRIIQEAFNNIIKHAGAANVQLVLHFNSSTLQVALNDDGRGFDKELAGSSNRAGLKNIETRIQILKGTTQLSSQPGKGTLLEFSVPLQ